jgi:hypothetical protein
MPLVNFSALISLLRAFLESRIDDLDRNLMLFTGAVVVGLFLEYAPEFLEKALRLERHGDLGTSRSRRVNVGLGIRDG